MDDQISLVGLQQVFIQPIIRWTVPIAIAVPADTAPADAAPQGTFTTGK